MKTILKRTTSFIYSNLMAKNNAVKYNKTLKYKSGKFVEKTSNF